MTDYKEELRRTLEVLRKGGIVLYPTDTVWGLGCDATNPEAVAKIYALKHRSDSKSLVLLASDVDMICRYVRESPEMAVQLIEVNDRPMTIIYPGALHGEAGQPADSPHGIREELGDALFILCKIAQMSGVDPEDALHRACDKYQGRFRRVADAADRPLNNYTEAEKIMRQHRWDENIGRLHTTEIIQNLTDELHEVGVCLTKKQQDTLMRLMIQYHNGSRLWCLRGWKPNELADMHGNSGVPSISFGPGLQQAFADGIMDKGDLIRKIQELGWKVME